MPRFEYGVPEGMVPDYLEPIALGGTSGRTVIDAVTNLGLVSASILGQPNGAASLDASVHIPMAQLVNNGLETPVVTGPTSLAPNAVGVYTIVNYNRFNSYIVHPVTGAATLKLDTITYTAPGSVGNGGFTINGTPYVIPIIVPGVVRPVITSPVNASTNLTASVSFTADAFQVVGPADTHASSDWQLATDAGFVTIVQSVTDNATYKTFWSVTGLNPNTTYYSRVRYKGTNDGYSPWSTIVSFSTKASFLPTAEQAILTTPLPYPIQASFTTHDIDGTGDRIVVGASEPNGPTYARFFVFVKINNTWTLEQSIADSTYGPANVTRWVSSIKVSGDGTRFIAMIQTLAGGTTYTYTIATYVRSGSVWTKDAVFAPAAYAGLLDQRCPLTIDATGTRVAFSCNSANVPGNTNPYLSYIYIYSRSGSTWTPEQVLLGNDSIAGDGFGQASIGFDLTGSRIVIANRIGGIYTFTRSGSTWSQEAKLTPPGDFPGPEYLLISGILNGDSDRIICSIGRPGDGNLSVYVYHRTGSTWTQEAKLLADAALISFGQATWSYLQASLDINDAGDLVVVGAPYEVYNGHHFGTVYLFTRSGTTWTKQIKYSSSKPLDEDIQFGNQVRLTGDGGTVTSATIDGTSTFPYGAIYVYR